MRFAEPAYLWGLLVIPALLMLYLAAEKRRRQDLALWLAPQLWERLASVEAPGWRRASAALLLLAAALLLFGAARPQLGSRILETRQRGSDVVLAVDVSLSMEARDLPPSRIGRARQELLALLDRLRGDRVALVSFANSAFLQCPLTLDRGAIRMLLPLLDPASVPEPGSNLEEAISRAVEAFQEDPRRGRAIVLISDGESHEGDLDRAIATAKEARARVCAIGVGRLQGDPIPLEQKPGRPPAYKKDREGRVVITRLVEEPLRRICDETGGTYIRAEAGMAGGRIATALRDLDQSEMRGGLGIRYEERFAYFAALALGLLFVEGLLVGWRRKP